MPRIKHRNYAVEYDINPDPGAMDLALRTEEFTVRVITADVLDAEQHAPTYGINDPTRQAIALNTMWIWRAALRTGHIPQGTGWPEFRRRCIDWSSVDAVEVPPTQPGASNDFASISAPDSSEASTSTAGDRQHAQTNDS